MIRMLIASIIVESNGFCEGVYTGKEHLFSLGWSGIVNKIVGCGALSMVIYLPTIY